MVQRRKLTKSLSGVSGEFFVAAELSRRGYIASVTLRNAKGVDILCSNPEATKAVGIQVKTAQGKNKARGWPLSKNAENFFSDNLFYVFVNLNDGEREPDYFIVPSKEVGPHIKESHLRWLKTPGKKGQKHNDSPMRRFNDHNDKYLNRWDILGLD